MVRRFLAPRLLIWQPTLYLSLLDWINDVKLRACCVRPKWGWIIYLAHKRGSEKDSISTFGEIYRLVFHSHVTLTCVLQYYLCLCLCFSLNCLFFVVGLAVGYTGTNLSRLVHLLDQWTVKKVQWVFTSVVSVFTGPLNQGAHKDTLHACSASGLIVHSADKNLGWVSVPVQP